jgi:hypothetical protein
VLIPIDEEVFQPLFVVPPSWPKTGRPVEEFGVGERAMGIVAEVLDQLRDLVLR